MLVCKKCNQTKPPELFRKVYHKKNKNYDTPSGTCKDCYREYDNEYRRKNNVMYNKNVRKRRNANKLFAIEYKGGKCNDCGGVFHQAAFDFHHLDPNEKDVDPGLLMSSTREKIKAEIDKCILLCSNCHRVRHYIELE